MYKMIELFMMVTLYQKTQFTCRRYLDWPVERYKMGKSFFLVSTNQLIISNLQIRNRLRKVFYNANHLPLSIKIKKKILNSN